ncbi:Cof-type HAD-IIB family hydrolase [Metabacillus arenae]|uniref:HAD family phosphatase n=1 Tax=Metabacillus arenae TaxID=2771434 RepID=A0A926NED6_9BACI|nr:Cof-type HAD-IIB family hydrolase [Metabacillus arenae]MBD1378913.1 HAD family phosphatase [Metabacillus arenae]
MKMTKLIAIDLDGTLLNNKNEVSKENLEAIRSAQENGVEVVIATGRAYFDVREIFKNTGIKTWIIGANGATIHHPDGGLFHSVPIEKDDAAEILQWLEKEEFYYEVFSNEAIFTPLNGRELLQIEMDRVISANPEVTIEELTMALEKQFSQTGFTFIESYQEIISSPADIYNILAFSFHKDKLEKGWNKYKELEHLTLVTSANHNFELEHKQASKGHALEKLAVQLGIDLRDTAAIGDSMNDVSMLKKAGLSIAMGNARQEVKDISDHVTLGNDENGVAHTLNSVVVKKKIIN